MSIASEIQSMETNLGNAYDAAQQKGATIPADKNLVNLPSTINSIPTGSSPMLGTLNATSNGTYLASQDGYDGYDTVNVNVPQSSGYVRPSDWITIPSITGNEDEIYVLVGVTRENTNASITLYVDGITSVDWGDGTSESISSTGMNQTISHTYDYESLSNYTTHNNSMQALIHIIANSGVNITRFQLPSMSYEIQANCQSCEVYPTNCKYIEVFSWNGDLTNNTGQSMFRGCYCLQEISPLNFTNNITNATQMFTSCYLLPYIPQFDTSHLTNISSMFESCRSLKSLRGLNTSNVTTFVYFVNGCNNLTDLGDLKINSATSLSGMLTSQSTNSIFVTHLPLWDTRNITNFSSAFNNCRYLEELPPYNTSQATDISGIAGYSSVLTKAYNYDIRNVEVFSTQFTNAFYLSQLTHLVLFGCNNNYQGDIDFKFGNASIGQYMSDDELIEFCNGFGPNSSGYNRNAIYGPYTTVPSRLQSIYVRDTGSLYSAILATNDTVYDGSKTYYTFSNYTNDPFVVATINDFEPGVVYFEEVAGTWNRYEACESTDAGAITLYQLLTTVKGWTIS